MIIKQQYPSFSEHAIRKNLAWRFWLESVLLSGDLWEALFEKVKKARAGIKSDLERDWVFLVENGCKIEHYIPALPLSQDRSNAHD